MQCDFERKGRIVYYIPEGGGGFQKSVVYQNFTPHKIITYENCSPPSLAITVFKMHPPPPPTLQPLLDQVSSFILGH